MGKKDKKKPDIFSIRKIGYDYEVDLGSMKRAIIIAHYGSGYGISIRSFFPFSEDDRYYRYHTAKAAMKAAFRIIRDWMDNILNSDGIPLEEEMRRIKG